MAVILAIMLECAICCVTVCIIPMMIVITNKTFLRFVNSCYIVSLVHNEAPVCVARTVYIVCPYIRLEAGQCKK